MICASTVEAVHANLEKSERRRYRFTILTDLYEIILQIKITFGRPKQALNPYRCFLQRMFATGEVTMQGKRIGTVMREVSSKWNSLSFKEKEVRFESLLSIKMLSSVLWTRIIPDILCFYPKIVFRS